MSKKKVTDFTYRSACLKMGSGFFDSWLKVF